jgi:hypothetical protein
MTREEFSHHWEKKHAPLVIPWALKYGVEYYAQASPLLDLHPHLSSPHPNPTLSTTSSPLTHPQIHNPRPAPAPTTPSPAESLPADLNLEDWDGAAEMKFPSPEKMAAAFADPYYANVILPDERRFLASEATMHMRVVPAGRVDGEKRVILEGGQGGVKLGCSAALGD